MRPGKRARNEAEEEVGHSGSPEAAAANGYSVCDQCRFKKIRCGRERPHCLNCSRVGQECLWSGQGKKRNQITNLNQTAVAHGMRLERVEGAIAEIQSSLSSASSGAGSKTSTVSSPGGQFSATESGRSPDSSPSSTSGSCQCGRRPGRRHSVYDNTNSNMNGSKREGYSGPTSLLCLIGDFTEFVLEPACNEPLPSDDTFRSVADRVRERLGRLAAAVQDEETFTDARGEPPPSRPPVALLEAMMDAYFDLVNPRMPIWTRQSFRRLVEAAQQINNDDPVQDRAYVVCSNNLILLALTAKSLQGAVRAERNTGPGQGGDTQAAPPSLDLDLVQSFVANAKRAIKTPELLLRPRLINVQALLSLCLVAQQYLDVHALSLLFNLAVHVAKSIRLHMPEFSNSQLSPDDVQERQQTLHCLRIMKAAVHWTMGWSPDMSWPVDASSTMMDDAVSRHLVARAKLAQIEERVYASLYARDSESHLRGCGETTRAVSELEQIMQDWWDEYGDEAAEDEPCDSYSAERVLAFRLARILVLWPIADNPDMRPRHLDDVRCCMRSFLRLWRNQDDLGLYASLTWLIGHYPLVGVLQLAAHDGAGSGDTGDLELLQSFVGMLRTLSGLSEPFSHVTKLYEFSGIVTDFAAACRHRHVMSGQCGLSWTPPSAANSAPFTRMSSMPSLRVDSLRGSIAANPMTQGGSIPALEGRTVDPAVSVRVTDAPDYTFSDGMLWDADSPGFNAIFTNPLLTSLGAGWEEPNLSLPTKD